MRIVTLDLAPGKVRCYRIRLMGPTRALVQGLNQRAKGKKMRPRSDAATDGDRWRMICDGGPDQTLAQTSVTL
jgi:hypothetical protein